MESSHWITIASIVVTALTAITIAIYNKRSKGPNQPSGNNNIIISGDNNIVTVGMSDSSVQKLIKNALDNSKYQEKEILDLIETVNESLASTQRKEGTKVNAAIVAYNEGDIDESIALLEKELDFKEQNIEEDYSHLADMNALNLNFSKALEYYKKAEQLSGQGTYNQSIAKMHVQLGQYDLALPILKKVMEDGEDLLKAGFTAIYASMVKDYLEILVALNQNDKARVVYDDAIEKLSLDKKFGKDSIELLSVIYTRMMSDNDCNKESELIKIINQEEEIFGSYHTRMASPLNDLAQYYDSKNDFDKSVQLYRKIIDIYKSQHDVDFSNEIGIVHINLAFNALKRNEYKEASDAMTVAFERLGKEHPFLNNTLPRIIQTLLDNKEYELVLLHLTNLKSIKSLDSESNQDELYSISQTMDDIKGMLS